MSTKFSTARTSTPVQRTPRALQPYQEKSRIPGPRAQGGGGPEVKSPDLLASKYLFSHTISYTATPPIHPLMVEPLIVYTTLKCGKVLFELFGAGTRYLFLLFLVYLPQDYILVSIINTSQVLYTAR